MPAPFHAYGTTHLTVLWACVATLLLLTLLRRFYGPGAVLLERLIGVLLLLTWPLTSLSHWRLGTLTWTTGLPLHFCDVAGIAGGIALLTKNRLAAEIVYFFGLAGTLQGLITPNLQTDYPDPRFIAFFFLHGGVVVTALHAVTSMGCPPREWAIPRMVGLTLAYAATVALVNVALSSNFAFLCQKPEQASLMDALGPWPWYIGSLVLLCGVFYSVLYAPFFIGRQIRSRRAPAAA